MRMRMRIPDAILQMCFCLAATVSIALIANAETIAVNGRQFTIPDGYKLSLAIAPGLCERPIVADFDHDGHLYVAESSGTNDNVQKQLEDKPHSILKLTDTNRDGVFDKRTVFANRMMFPAGVLWHRGSVYVSAPPQIWKLTDTDDDGVADKRVVWFDAKTLTGCANDLHGPYLGLDGWIYWCKGAFAEQTYPRPNGSPFVTRAAHIFRRHPTGGPVEPVMSGGMDNPVDVVFTATGERIFTTTFFQHPANGQRDGLVHAIYGGVYGKRHGVIDGHPRTGELMPVMTHLGAAAPSGLVRLRSDSLGFRNDLLTACFNLHSVTRHELIPKGATFESKDTVSVSSDDLDFHPTDVVEAADGSVLIVDTGGWYKLCCPTSQLHKPDVPGAIYRLTKSDSRAIKWPYGEEIDWPNLVSADLARLLADERFAVRKRAMEMLATAGAQAVPSIRSLVENSDSAAARQSGLWCACRIDSPKAREVVRLGLNDQEASVRHVAAHAVGLWRDTVASDRLLELLGDDSAQVQRAAAEALGRIGEHKAVRKLLEKLSTNVDRVLEHSLIYALIEINAVEELHLALVNGNDREQRAALLAIRGSGNQSFSIDEVSKFLVSHNRELQTTAVSIASDHADWSAEIVSLFRTELKKDSSRLGELAEPMGELAHHQAMSHFVAELLESDQTSPEQKVALLHAIPDSNERFDATFERLMQSVEPSLVSATVRKLAYRDEDLSESLVEKLKAVAESVATDSETRLLAARRLRVLDAKMLDEVNRHLQPNQPARTRSLAVSVLETVKLDDSQLLTLTSTIRSVGPLELSRLLRLFQDSTNPKLGQQLFNSLASSDSATALPPEQISQLAKQFGDQAMTWAKPLLATAALDLTQQANRLESMLSSLPNGDIRRGQKIFHNQKLACFTCHAIGYRGGNIGPDLSRIGRTRSRRDLLEAILYPSASFVRSYEPVNVITTDGRQFAGTIRNQTSDELELQLNATEFVSISGDKVEEILPGKVSIMPSGLDKQLSHDELADLLSFLESRK